MCKLACIAGLSLYLFLLLMDKNPQSFSYSIILFLYIYTILTMFSLTVFKQYMNWEVRKLSENVNNWMISYKGMKLILQNCRILTKKQLA